MSRVPAASCTKRRDDLSLGGTLVDTKPNTRDIEVAPAAVSPTARQRTVRLDEQDESRRAKFLARPAHQQRCDRYRPQRDDQHERPGYLWLLLRQFDHDVRGRCHRRHPGMDPEQRHLVRGRHARWLLRRIDRRADWQHRQPLRHDRHRAAAGRVNGNSLVSDTFTFNSGTTGTGTFGATDHFGHRPADYGFAGVAFAPQAAAVAPVVTISSAAPRPASPQTVTVTAEYTSGPDIGQTDTSYTGTIAFTSSDPQRRPAGQLYVHRVATTASHTFTNGVTLKTAGSQTVTATDTVAAALAAPRSRSVPRRSTNWASRRPSMRRRASPSASPSRPKINTATRSRATLAPSASAAAAPAQRFPSTIPSSPATTARTPLPTASRSRRRLGDGHQRNDHCHRLGQLDQRQRHRGRLCRLALHRRTTSSSIASERDRPISAVNLTPCISTNTTRRALSSKRIPCRSLRPPARAIALTGAGNALSEGQMSLSPNGEYLALTGYDTGINYPAPSRPRRAPRSPARSASSAPSGSVNTTTALTDFSSGDNVRSAVTTNGTNIWVSRQQRRRGLYDRRQRAPPPAIDLSSSQEQNVGQVEIVDGQLYVSSKKVTDESLFGVGTGAPAAPSQTLNPLSIGSGQFVGNQGEAADGYFLTQENPSSGGPDTLYLSDSAGINGDGLGDIEKYSLVRWNLEFRRRGRSARRDRRDGSRNRHRCQCQLSRSMPPPAAPSARPERSTSITDTTGFGDASFGRLGQHACHGSHE